MPNGKEEALKSHPNVILSQRRSDEVFVDTDRRFFFSILSHQMNASNRDSRNVNTCIDVIQTKQIALRHEMVADLHYLNAK